MNTVTPTPSCVKNLSNSDLKQIVSEIKSKCDNGCTEMPTFPIGILQMLTNKISWDLQLDQDSAAKTTEVIVLREAAFRWLN